MPCVYLPGPAPAVTVANSTAIQYSSVAAQEAKYVEGWPNKTSAWAGWSRFDIPMDRPDGVHSLLICTSSTLESPTCH
jgi:hypothetical protein